MKRWYDQKVQERLFVVDDLVLVLLPSSNKLLEKWQGPFPITDILSPITDILSPTTCTMSGWLAPGRFLARTMSTCSPGGSPRRWSACTDMLTRWESPSVVCLHSSVAESQVKDHEDMYLVNNTLNRSTQRKPGTAPDPDRRATPAPCRPRQGIHRSTRTHTALIHLHRHR